MKRAIVAAAVLFAMNSMPVSAHSAGLDGLLTGVNGLLTWPADPVLDTIDPPEDFQDFPAASVIRYPLGFLYGTGLGIIRAGTGLLDIALTPFWIIPNASPDPRFDVIPFYELEEAP